MSEFDLLRDYHELNQQLHELELVIHYRDGVERKKIQASIDDLRFQLLELSSSLVSFPDNRDSRATKQSMMQQISAYMQHIKGARSGLLVSRNQGLMIENYLIGKVIQDVRWFLFHEPLGGYSIPDLLYTYQPNLGIERERVIDALRSELIELENLSPVNYMSLLNLTEQMRPRLFSKLSS